MRSRPAVLVIMALSVLLLPGQGASSASRPMDTEEDCLELVPEQVSVAGLTDDGQEVTLDVLVLLDGPLAGEGPSKKEAIEVFDMVAEAYAPLNIVVQPTFQRAPPLPVPSTVHAPDLIEASKEVVGGERPEGIDVVYTLTTRDFTQSTAGQADCIGGVRYPARAFAVGKHRVDSEYSDELGPVSVLKYRSAKVATHEIGHLLGAVHEYGNCAEGDHSDPTDDFGGECTVMFPDVFFVSQRFGTLEAAVVRGHAVEYAAD